MEIHSNTNYMTVWARLVCKRVIYKNDEAVPSNLCSPISTSVKTSKSFILITRRYYWLRLYFKHLTKNVRDGGTGCSKMLTRLWALVFKICLSYCVAHSTQTNNKKNMGLTRIWFCVVDWMEADLNVSLQLIVRKGWGLRAPNDWS